MRREGEKNVYVGGEREDIEEIGESEEELKYKIVIEGGRMIEDEKGKNKIEKGKLMIEKVRK